MSLKTKLVTKNGEPMMTVVNTKLMLQNDLEQLYTGDQISPHYVYAYNFTYLFCTMMFATGMPLLYLLAAIFYAATYWIYKILLLKFYMKNKFSEDLPISAFKTANYALLLHVLFGGYMITNSQISPEKPETGDKLPISLSKNSPQVIMQLFKNQQSLAYLIMTVMVIAWIISKGTILSILTKMRSTISRCCGSLHLDAISFEGGNGDGDAAVRSYCIDIYKDMDLNLLLKLLYTA